MRLSTLGLTFLSYASGALACAHYGWCKCYNPASGNFSDAVGQQACSAFKQVWDFSQNACKQEGTRGYDNCDWRQACNAQDGIMDWQTSKYWVDVCGDKQ
ncbi:hypothetical protein Tdes44962_MAKER01465 [Teratosphaeria destructans]|uniref:Uncharacterized protein n=1 Tax=Teratosphaeria destructans TaxID=418781 RepID=A0A9W7SZB3_9PEZI|nr:hypothetical protein Tdes44962_MAKER01465 [Teratosphaeria destructans]